MKERPILFSAPMVKALLAGTKTQMRRIVKRGTDPIKLKAIHHGLQAMYGTSPDGFEFGDRGLWREVGPDYPDADDDNVRCPYGAPGDRLWVRETWRTFERPDDGADGIRYFADDSFRQIENSRAAQALWIDEHKNGRHGDHWRPSIYMKRWSSRITLEVTSVRVERLQSITDEDARAEGVHHSAAATAKQCTVDTHGMGTHRAAFAALWDSINGKRAPWASNPLVWVVSFRVRQ